MISICITPDAFAKENTRLSLDPLPRQATAGEIITFSGKLTDVSGTGLIGGTIYIKDDDKWGPDDLIVKTVTEKNGKFKVSVIVKDWDRWSQDTEIYAVFEGTSSYGSSRSNTYNVYVTEEKPSVIKKIPIPAPTFRETQTFLDPINISSTKIDTTIYLFGKLVSDGKPLSSEKIVIKRQMAGIDPVLATGYTDQNGKFVINWYVDRVKLSSTHLIYATFEGNSNYQKSESSKQNVSIKKYYTKISLNYIPSMIKVGDRIDFSGKLSFEKGSPKGAIVYIKDEDTLNPDDLLVAAYVNGDGTFNASWIARNTDVNDAIEIYAVFEGTRELYRSTTCGGGCSDTIKLTILEPTVTTRPPATDEKYFELDYTLSFNKRPIVAIIPSPDDYKTTQRAIAPSQEGILFWSSDMKKKFGGNWDVDFFVVKSDSAFFEKKPDIILNLVSYENKKNMCLDGKPTGKAAGVPFKPINTWVCATYDKNPRSPTDVAATSAHEFAHAMGLGHAFNLEPDMLCSVEDGKPTCPNWTYKQKTPSAFSQYAMMVMYGKDGFLNPNNSIPRDTIFTANDYIEILNNGITQPTPSPQKTLPPITKPNPDSDGDGIPNNRDSCPANRETYNGYKDYDGCPDTVPPKVVTPKVIDTDNDGISDDVDYCDHRKENYNGYKDYDGCPDTVPTDRKTQSMKLQSEINQRIIDAKNGIILAEYALKNTWYPNKQSQVHLENAWEQLWWAKKYLGDAEWTQKEGEIFISESKFKEAYFKYKYSSDKADKINHKLDAITRFMDNAKRFAK